LQHQFSHFAEIPCVKAIKVDAVQYGQVKQDAVRSLPGEKIKKVPKTARYALKLLARS
jgi:hypothetical protein